MDGELIPDTIIFSEWAFYCPFRDQNVVRVSVPDRHGSEFWMIVEQDGKGYRDRRKKAIDCCLEAMEAGCSPGEVRIA